MATQPTTRIAATLAAASAIAITGCGALSSATEPRAEQPLRQSLTGEQFYFVMADRFADGDPANNTGGYGDDPLVSGYDPTDAGFYQGGDLAGLRDNLDYIEGLGTTAIWLTPSFTNKPVQARGLLRRLPRLLGHRLHHDRPAPGDQRRVCGTRRRGARPRHEGVPRHHHQPHRRCHRLRRGDRVAYVSKDDAPYLDADGVAFDDRDVAGTADFPTLDAQTSFPYTPQARPARRTPRRPRG
ncbi:hypothetical protein GCM10025876_36070 [Demequina litorisediminis]|uniref:Glycosyl hydrolase family 13 catalytic domain-containing protein n=1 Tax=Demequina litorisediminis TaxID=1849022 RepID=A0ABQ6IHN3_9MICO|nr:hypothetical protein GCM10025876_36070 [Demequina litorisediminis]